MDWRNDQPQGLDCPDKNKINRILDDIIIRIQKADELHEQFLHKEDEQE